MRTLAMAVASLLLAAAPASAGLGHSHSHSHGHSHANGGSHPTDWNVTVVDEDQSFRGLDAVDQKTAWVTGGSLTEGGAGKVYRTTDGGLTWKDVSPPGTEGLSLRDVEATSARTAVVMSVGSGADSRIWRTDNGGATWTETFRNTDPAAFYNCLDFYPGGRRGLVVSDSVDDKFRIAATDDGGRSWHVLPNAGMPSSAGEFNFSASGDCLVIRGHNAYFGSGGAAARVYRSTDRGITWTASESTIPTGEAAGVFALAFRSPRRGIAVGGDFLEPADGVDASAYTSNGRVWTNAGNLTHLAEDAARLRGHRTILVVGQSGEVGGTSISHDGGRSWTLVSNEAFHTLDCVKGACWAAGSGGRVGVR